MFSFFGSCTISGIPICIILTLSTSSSSFSDYLKDYEYVLPSNSVVTFPHIQHFSIVFSWYLIANPEHGS